MSATSVYPVTSTVHSMTSSVHPVTSNVIPAMSANHVNSSMHSVNPAVYPTNHGVHSVASTHPVNSTMNLVTSSVTLVTTTAHSVTFATPVTKSQTTAVSSMTSSVHSVTSGVHSVTSSVSSTSSNPSPSPGVNHTNLSGPKPKAPECQYASCIIQRRKNHEQQRQKHVSYYDDIKHELQDNGPQRKTASAADLTTVSHEPQSILTNPSQPGTLRPSLVSTRSDSSESRSRPESDASSNFDPTYASIEEVELPSKYATLSDLDLAHKAEQLEEKGQNLSLLTLSALLLISLLILILNYGLN